MALAKDDLGSMSRLVVNTYEVGVPCKFFVALLKNLSVLQCIIIYNLYYYFYASVDGALEAYGSRHVCPSVCLSVCVLFCSTFFSATAKN